jgi:MoxR-like ATPase
LTKKKQPPFLLHIEPRFVLLTGRDFTGAIAMKIADKFQLERKNAFEFYNAIVRRFRVLTTIRPPDFRQQEDSVNWSTTRNNADRSTRNDNSSGEGT